MNGPKVFRASDAPQNVVSNADQVPADRGNTSSDRKDKLEDGLSATQQQPGGEEPELALEPDLPSDGRDALGEAMIRDLPRRTELTEFLSPSDPSKQQT